MGAIIVAGDALDTASLDKAFDSIEEVDAVISTVGGTSANPQVDGQVSPACCHAPASRHLFSWQSRRRMHPCVIICSIQWSASCSSSLAQLKTSHKAAQGNINIIEAAIKKGVKKFILVTSIGVGDSKDAPPKQVCIKPAQLAAIAMGEHPGNMRSILHSCTKLGSEHCLLQSVSLSSPLCISRTCVAAVGLHLTLARTALHNACCMLTSDLELSSTELCCAVQVYQVLEPVLKEKVKAEDHLKVPALPALNTFYIHQLFYLYPAELASRPELVTACPSLLRVEQMYAAHSSVACRACVTG